MKKYNNKSNENYVNEIVKEIFREEQTEYCEHEYSKFYEKLRNRIKKYASKKDISEQLFNILVTIPDMFNLLYHLAIDKNISKGSKRKLIIAIIYFLAPIDLIPDLFAPFGYMDDAYIIVMTLNSLLNTEDSKYINKYWLGKTEIIDFIKSTIRTLNSYFDFAKLYKSIYSEQNSNAKDES